MALPEADILHAYRNAIRYIEVEQDGEERLIVIGPDRSGNCLELVAMPSETPTGSSTPLVYDPSSTTS